MSLKKSMKLFLAVLTFSVFFAALSMTASAETYSGDCGDVTWVYDDEAKTLTFSGSGPIPDYETIEMQQYKSYIHNGVETVVFGNGITRIGNYTLSVGAGTTIKKIVMADTVTEIGVGAFKDCQNLSSLMLSDNLLSIGSDAFSYCCDLTALDLPDTVTSIGSNAFDFCTRIERIKFPASLKDIDSRAFEYCVSLTAANLGDTKLQTIGEYAFDSCTALKTVTLPSSLASVGDRAFYYSNKIEDIYCSADPKNIISWSNDPEEYKQEQKTVCHVKSEYVQDYRSRFINTIEADPVNLTFTGDLEEKTAAAAYIKGATLTAGGDISVNLYLVLPETVAADQNAYIMVKGPDDSEAKRIPLSGLRRESDNKGNLGSYIASCQVNSAQIGEGITFTLYNGENEIVPLWNTQRSSVYETFTYSVNRYINAVRSRSDNLGVLASKMQNYGTWAREYLIGKGNLSSDKTAEISMPKTVEGVAASDLSKYKIDNQSGLNNLNMSLVLESQTSLRLYYSGDPIEATASSERGSVQVENGQGENLNYAEIKDISAPDLDTVFTFNFGDSKTVKVSALSFAELVLRTSQDNSSNLCNMVKALYEYSQAANTYFGC